MMGGGGGGWQIFRHSMWSRTSKQINYTKDKGTKQAGFLEDEQKFSKNIR